ncbi:MAG TPA: VOC family protein [Verrucomicrobiae bacterium]|jgi:predicted 3-demethylubiquinone-9 3-methyltransferase (glyoxalase superfamily)|nr:VOC family protein [Verrucomicrobiae bacterium]
MQKINPFLWFNGDAEPAAKFYTSIFKKSKIRKISRYDAATAKACGQPAGSVMTIEFELEGQKFIALNGGPQFKFNESVSFVVNCKTQAELDRYWKKLSAGGQEVACGWLKDKYGLSWQIVPEIIGDLLSGKDPAKSARVMQAVMKMVKLDIKTLKAAYAGKVK